MRNTPARPAKNRTITIEFHKQATYFQLLATEHCRIGHGVHPSIGFQLKHKAIVMGGCVTRHSQYVRVRRVGFSTASPVYEVQSRVHRAAAFRLRYRRCDQRWPASPLATTGAQLELCAVICTSRYGAPIVCLCARPSQYVAAPPGVGCPCPRMSGR